MAIDRKEEKKTDLLILCGDVQTLRNVSDLHCLAVPEKYKKLGDFHHYYNGQREAPILTLLIGGNHEASNYLWELYYGGWVAPNMYFLGEAGCIEVGGLTIAGISGIYKSHDFTLGRFESMPYNGSTVRSVYHTRSYDTFRLHLLSHLQASINRPDIVLSHDWPNTIEQSGDVRWLMQKKPFFRDEIKSRSLGSPPLMDLLHDLKPRYWFSAHLHVRFAAQVRHNVEKEENMNEEISATSTKKIENEEEVMIDIDGDDEITKDESDLHQNKGEIDTTKVLGNKLDNVLSSTKEVKVESLQDGMSGMTRFLALSKCMEGQDFLQILDVSAPFDHDINFRDLASGSCDTSKRQPSLRFSPSWLAILRATYPLLSLERNQIPLPSLNDPQLVKQLEMEYEWIKSHLLTSQVKEGHPLDILQTQQFVQTAPSTLDPNANNMSGPPSWYTNPQTVNLCNLLQIQNRINAPPPAIPTSSDMPGHHIFAPFLQPPQIQQNGTNTVTTFDDTSSARNEEHSLVNSDEILVTLSDEEDENTRWKEGAG